MTSAETSEFKTGSPLERATNPEATVWVSANAGSGKTYVLSRRVIRLMLEGADPAQLLCLTFTKAAAAEMSNRVFEILGTWSMLDTGLLNDEIKEITGRHPDTKMLTRARQLFALALDAPGGLKIQTIHAFCEALLHQFPLEANVPGHFEMMDDLDRSLMLEEAQSRVVRASLIKPETETAVRLSACYDIIREHGSDQAIADGMEHLIRHREAFAGWIDHSPQGSVSSAMDPLWEKFGLSTQDQPAKLLEDFRTDTIYQQPNLQKLVSSLRTKTGTRSETALALLEQIGSCKDAALHHQLRKQLVLTAKDEARAYLVSEAFMKDHDLLDDFRAEQERVLGQVEKLKALEVLKASEALFTIGEAILTEFANLKQRRGLLDFEDLIVKAANLLNRNEIAQWIQYKLDGGISHVLVDEAQDTSPLQWQIIEAIIQEFFSGKGAREKTRTLFVVGDKKQSIYSFQGADPAEFDRQFRKIRDQVSGSGNIHELVSLNESYRSTPEILSAVDQVFSLEENRRGLGADLLAHTARKRHDHTGEVLLWEMQPRETKPEITDWLAPHDASGEEDAEVILAKKIATTIKGWIENEETLPGREAKIRFGDVLILVRKRDRFVDAINRELKQQGLVSAGADRLALNRHIVFEDMVALGRFVSTKIDDLSLAGLLKSPMFDFNDDDLFHVAHERGTKSLYEALGSFGSSEAGASDEHPLKNRCAAAIPVLNEMLTLAQDLPVFEFFSRLFARHDLRKKYLQRMGNEVGEVIDGFLHTAMNYDSRYGLGLQGFVEWLSASNLELKREVDMQSNEIRVITAHSAKGLEAPIVFLVDPGSPAFNAGHAPDILSLEGAGGKYGWLWQASAAQRLTAGREVLETIQAAAEEEYRRLLYVGMTRAADRLIVCGYRPEKAPGYAHWHSMIKAGLEAGPVDPKLGGKLVEDKAADGNFAGWRWVLAKRNGDSRLMSDRNDTIDAGQSPLPAWLSKVPSEPVPPRPISPSGIMGLLEIEQNYDTASGADSTNALAKGNAIHDLLHVLPDLPPNRVDAALASYFARHGTNIAESEIENIRRQVLALLQNREFQTITGPGSRCEVEITGTVVVAGKRQLITGRIDRLSAKRDQLILTDYKTNRNVPESPAEISSAYIGQMALYRELARHTDPDRKIVCKFVWTENSTVMDVPDKLLDEWMTSLNHS